LRLVDTSLVSRPALRVDRALISATRQGPGPPIGSRSVDCGPRGLADPNIS